MGEEGRKGCNNPVVPKEIAGGRMGSSEDASIVLKAMAGGTSISKTIRGVLDTQWSLPLT